MKLQKRVIKIGGSLGIIFDKVIQDTHNLEEGDIADISDIVFTKGEKDGNN